MVRWSNPGKDIEETIAMAKTKEATKLGKSIRERTIALLEETPETRLKRTIERIGKLAAAKKTVFFQKDGEVTDTRDVEDNTTQLGANKFIMELHDSLPSQKHEVEVLTREDVLKRIHERRDAGK